MTILQGFTESILHTFTFTSIYLWETACVQIRKNAKGEICLFELKHSEISRSSNATCFLSLDVLVKINQFKRAEELEAACDIMIVHYLTLQ